VPDLFSRNIPAKPAGRMLLPFEIQQLSYLSNRESCFLGFENKFQPLQVISSIESITVRFLASRLEQPIFS
jgi:hypothetical protein